MISSPNSKIAYSLLFLCTVLLSGCISKPFYFPNNDVYSTPTDYGLSYEVVQFKSQDGTSLSGWFIPASNINDPRQAKGTIIHFHGNAENMTSHWQFVSWLPSHGFNLFVFDYRGYGASEGSPEPQGVLEDSTSAINTVRARQDIDPEKLFIIGQSLGGNNAIAAVGSGDRSGIRALVIDSTFYSYASIASDTIPGTGWLVSNIYSAADYVDQISPIPVLFIHGTKDSIVPHAHSERLYEKSREPKKLILIEGGEHIDALSLRYGTKYRDEVLKFFEEAVNQKKKASLP